MQFEIQKCENSGGIFGPGVMDLLTADLRKHIPQSQICNPRILGLGLGMHGCLTD